MRFGERAFILGLRLGILFGISRGRRLRFRGPPRTVEVIKSLFPFFSALPLSSGDRLRLHQLQVLLVRHKIGKSALCTKDQRGSSAAALHRLVSVSGLSIRTKFQTGTEYALGQTEFGPTAISLEVSFTNRYAPLKSVVGNANENVPLVVLLS